ncbi:hypothetical protein COCON_G00210040 [Conger conger]|uniref:Uncharacterized protein n=1 Tax=Conger conger TaxID=82655 RepID=A0A9Q1HPW6_CONCO|nr:hypothetical protein COCON_G00210040 [Conger conger]
MNMSPTHLPRTSSNAVAEGNSKINGLGPPTDSDTQEDNAIQACHMERSSSSLMQQTLQRALLFRCKSDTGPVSTGPGEKTSEDEETKPCPPIHPSLGLPRPTGPESTAPPLPPPDRSEQEQMPLYLEILPEESAASDVRRSPSLVTHKPEPPGPVHRTKSDPVPLFWKHVWFQLSLGQKAKLGAKLQKLNTSNRRPRPERPPPPNFTLNRGADRSPLQKEFTLGPSNGCDPPDGDSEAPPVDCDSEYENSLKLSGEDEKKPCTPLRLCRPLSPKSPNAPPPLPPTAGLDCSGSEPGDVHDYLVILPQESPTTQVSHLGRSTSFTLQPKPPAPMHHRTKSDSEPLSRKPAWFLLRLDQQKAKRGAKLQKRRTSDPPPRPERPPPPNFTLNRGADRPPLQKQTSISGPSNGCDPQDPPVDCDSEYEDNLICPALTRLSLSRPSGPGSSNAAPPLPPLAGLVRSASEPEPGPLDVETLPEETAATEVRPLERRTSLDTVKTNQPALVQRSKSASFPLLWKPARFQLSLDQQKANLGAKLQKRRHTCDQRRRP